MRESGWRSAREQQHQRHGKGVDVCVDVSPESTVRRCCYSLDDGDECLSLFEWMSLSLFLLLGCRRTHTHACVYYDLCVSFRSENLRQKKRGSCLAWRTKGKKTGGRHWALSVAQIVVRMSDSDCCVRHPVTRWSAKECLLSSLSQVVAASVSFAGLTAIPADFQTTLSFTTRHQEPLLSFEILISLSLICVHDS